MTFHQFFDTLRRRGLVACVVLAVGIALIYSFRGVIPNSYSGVAHVVLVSDNGSRDPTNSIVDLPSIATSTVVLEHVRSVLKLPTSLATLKASVSASVLGRSSIMSIAYRDLSAERAMSVANAVADELSRYYGQISTRSYDLNVDRLSQTMAAESDRIHALDAQMSRVVASDPYVVSDKAVDAITSELAGLNDDRAKAAAQLQGDSALAATTAPSVSLSDTARHEILADDPTYAALRTLVAKDGAALATDRAGYTREFPGLPGAIAKLNAEQQAADAEANRALSDVHAFSTSKAETEAAHERQLAAVVGDRARLAQIDQLIAVQQEALHDLPSTGMSYAQLRAERDALLTEYDGLATRRANALANRAEGSQLGSVVVLDRAIKADTQLAGSRTRVGLVALLLAFAAAIGAAVAVEALDPRLLRPKDVEELYGVPVVAYVGASR